MQHMEHYLKVKNFGPLKDVEIDLTNKDLIVLIGPQASGKSTIAKLLGMFMNKKLYTHNDLTGLTDFRVDATFPSNYFEERTKNYIENTLKEDWNLPWKNSKQKIEFKYHEAVFDYTPQSSTYLQADENLIYFVDAYIKSTKELPESNRYWARLALSSEYLLNGIISSLSNLSVTSDGTLMNPHLDEKFKKILGNDSFRQKIEAIKKILSEVNLKDKDKAFVLQNKLSETWEYLLSEFKFTLSSSEIVYIPAERAFFSILQDNKFGLNRQKLVLPNYLIDFGAFFETSRSEDEIFIPFINVNYKYESLQDKILKNGIEIKLEQSSSGFQSAIPMAVVVDALSKKESPSIFIIEEPELNLYPSTQKKLMEFLVEKCTKNGNKLIITTHSPYILTALNNHITAHNVAKVRPELADEVASKMPKEQWLDCDKVGAYYVDNGTAENIMHKEHALIDYSKFDEIADELGETYDSLIEMEYRRAN